MAWFVRLADDGCCHMVYSQKGDNACGIACIIMVNYKLKKGLLAAAAVGLGAGGLIAIPAAVAAFDSTFKAEQEVYDAYARATGVSYDGSTDTDATKHPLVLNKLGIGTWKAEWVPGTSLAEKIVTCLSGPKAAPVIILVHWGSGVGHFVVCDNLEKTGAVTTAEFCDPWDGAVRTLPLTKGQSIVYTSSDKPTFDFGQSHFKYATASTGDMDGWIVYRG